MSAISVAVLIAVALTYGMTRNVVEKTIIRHQQETVAKVADTVEIWMDQQKKILGATIDSIPMEHIGQNRETLGPLHMAMKAGHFSDVYIGTARNGKLIDGAEWTPPPWYDPRWRPWYKSAVAKGEITFTTPYVDLVVTQLVIALVAPLKQDGKIFGVIGADTVLDTLEQNVLRLKTSKHSRAFIVESEGIILVHPNREYVMRESIFNVEQNLKSKLSRFDGNTANSVMFRSKDQKDCIISYKRIADSSWFSCIIAPHEEAKNLARENTMIFATEYTLKALGLLAFIVLSGVTLSGTVVFMLNKRYSSTVKQHESEITGITEDLNWNILKRQEVETYYQTLFNVANDAILISKDLQITECNKKTEEIFARQRSELLGTNLLDLSPTYQADGTKSNASLRKILEALDGEEQQFFRWSFTRKDGSEFPSSVNVKAFTLQEEDVELLSIRDISKRVDAEAQLMQAQKMAAIGEMLGIIAHQWRQPLNTLSTYISSLQAAQYNDMLSKSFVEKLVAGADGQIKFMSKTIDDFRNFFKPSKTKEKIEIFSVIISAVKLMEAQVKNADINLTIKNNSGVNSLLVFGYKSEFVHVLVNIIANGRDALQEKDDTGDHPFQKKIEVRVNCDESSVFIDIIDNGNGIPDHILPHIFNPYYTTKTSKSGTGVGLYMTKMIVEKEMAGQVSAISGDGTTQFAIRLNRVYEEEKV